MTPVMTSADFLQRTSELREAIDRAQRDEDAKARACVDELLTGNGDFAIALTLARKSREDRDRSRALAAEVRELFGT